MSTKTDNTLTQKIVDPSPRKTARIAGLFYLVFVVLTIVATTVRNGIIVEGDAAATAAHLASSGLFLNAGVVVELFAAVFFVLAAWALYALLKPVNKNLALLLLVLNLGGAAVECLNTLNLYAAVQYLGGASYLGVFSAGQLQALALSSIDLYNMGFLICQIFFSFWLLPLGYLVYKSGFLPKFLGLLLILDFFGNMSWFMQGFFAPSMSILAKPGNAISFIAEIALTVWLLVMAVKEPKEPK
jgi:hypothetical protein